MSRLIFSHCIVCATCAQDAIDMRTSLERQGRQIAGLNLQLRTKDEYTARLQGRITQLETQLKTTTGESQ